MSVKKELGEWVQAFCKLVHEERRKSPILFWLLPTAAFLYAAIMAFLGKK
jgi:hypothetical protein